jgi:hypothetical protein
LNLFEEGKIRKRTEYSAAADDTVFEINFAPKAVSKAQLQAIIADVPDMIHPRTCCFHTIAAVQFAQEVVRGAACSSCASAPVDGLPPFQYHGRRATGQCAAKHGDGIDSELGLTVPVERVKVWRVMIIEIHANRNAKESANLGHLHTC